MLTYENGIVIGTIGKRNKIVLSNQYGYLGCYYGYKCFRPDAINSTQDLNDLKSRCLNSGAKIDWGTFQWCLNNFDKLKYME